VATDIRYSLSFSQKIHQIKKKGETTSTSGQGSSLVASPLMVKGIGVGYLGEDGFSATVKSTRQCMKQNDCLPTRN